MNSLGSRREREDMRFEGRPSPRQPIILLGGLPFALAIPLALIIWGRIDTLILVITLISMAVYPFLYLMSASRSRAILRPETVDISVWKLVPVLNRRVPYDAISRVQADDFNGNVAIWFTNEAGEADVAEIVLKTPSSASALRDAVTLRRSKMAPAVDFSEVQSKLAPLSEIDSLPAGSEKRQYRVDTSRWMDWLLIAGSPVLAVIFLMVQGDFSLPSWLVFSGLFLALAAFFTILERLQTYCFLQAKRADMRNGIHSPRHRIRYSDVLDAKGLETGWLMIKYTGRPTLGLGGGEQTAQIRLKPHSIAPAVADAILVGRDRARQGA